MNFPLLYPWIKALHVAAAFIFVAGVLLEAVAFWVISKNPTGSTSFIPLILAWGRMVTTPAMLATWSFGIALAIIGQWVTALWLIVKIVLVIILSGIHGVQSGALYRRSQGGKSRPLLTAPLVLISVVGIAILAIVEARGVSHGGKSFDPDVPRSYSLCIDTMLNSPSPVSCLEIFFPLPAVFYWRRRAT